MLRVLLAIVTGLVGAAVLHVIILLAIPHFSNRDAYTRAVAEGKPHLFHLLEETTEKDAGQRRSLHAGGRMHLQY